MTTQVHIIDWLSDTHTQQQYPATTSLVCSVYAFGFRKPFTCLGLHLAASHVGKDGDIFPLLFTKPKQSSLSCLYPLPLSTPTMRHIRDTHSAAGYVRVDLNWEG